MTVVQNRPNTKSYLKTFNLVSTPATSIITTFIIRDGGNVLALNWRNSYNAQIVLPEKSHTIKGWLTVLVVQVHTQTMRKLIVKDKCFDYIDE